MSTAHGAKLAHSDPVISCLSGISASETGHSGAGDEPTHQASSGRHAALFVNWTVLNAFVGSGQHVNLSGGYRGSISHRANMQCKPCTVGLHP